PAGRARRSGRPDAPRTARDAGGRSSRTSRGRRGRRRRPGIPPAATRRSGSTSPGRRGELCWSWVRPRACAPPVWPAHRWAAAGRASGTPGPARPGPTLGWWAARSAGVRRPGEWSPSPQSAAPGCAARGRGDDGSKWHHRCMTNFRVRRALADTPAYRPGRPPAAVEGVTSYKLSSNESHLEPLPAVVEAVAGASGAPALYPDPAAARLTDALADYHGAPADHVVLSAGSSEALAALVGITLEPGAEVVYPWPSFEMYPQLSSFSGATQIAVPLTADGRHDLPAMAQAITDATRLVLLCSPNNP